MDQDVAAGYSPDVMRAALELAANNAPDVNPRTTEPEPSGPALPDLTVFSRAIREALK